MGETLHLLFRNCEHDAFEIQVKEHWSGRTVSGSFIPPYTAKQLNALLKKLNNFDLNSQDLRDIGHKLFLALCGASGPVETRNHASSGGSKGTALANKDPNQVAGSTNHQGGAEQSVEALLRGVIQRTLRRRGTVALTLSFDGGCEEFVRYPWELLHNGDHFLLGSGIFTLTRALLRPGMPHGCELPVHLPMRVLYIGASPIDCPPLETEQSFAQMERALAPLIDAGQVFLDRLEPATFDQLVRYLNSYGGASMLDDSETTIPCYVVHFDGHGAYGRLCPDENCETVNEPDARKCVVCSTSLTRVKPQTYLCFCTDEGYNRFIDTQSLRDLFLSSDVRLAVFSACETATFVDDSSHSSQRPHKRNAVDATLATALVMAQVPAVVAMPFSLQDDLSPTFMYHFYEALADGRTLEEALARARQALLPMQQRGWFIPVLYRHIVEGDEGPVPLLAIHDTPEEHDHPLAHLGASSTFVGREQELHTMNALLTAAATGSTVEPIIGLPPDDPGSYIRLRQGTHHIALTGPAGIGKSAIAYEAVRRNQEKFPGGVIGVSLQGGKLFGDALLDIMHQIHVPSKAQPLIDVAHRARLVLGTLRSLANRELSCLLLLDSFEEIKDHSELETWLHFLCSLPQEIVVFVTSRSNPGSMMAPGGAHCRWYEFRVDKMTNADLLSLFGELAAASGLDQRIHLADPRQQAVLKEICTLLDGYPLGAELIFGTARSIDGKVYTPEAATRSLEEVRDELRSTPLAGILSVLDVSYRRLAPTARLLLAYLAIFELPFSREQISMILSPDTPAPIHDAVELVSEYPVLSESSRGTAPIEAVNIATLRENWRAARDELVQASFIQFDGRVYTLHPQVRHFAISHLPGEERRRLHRIVAAYYHRLPQPSPQEWFVAFNHLESAGEPADMQQAVQVAVRASWALHGRGYAPELLSMLRRAGVHASHLGDKTGEGQVQCCLGAILRHQGRYLEAEACLRSSLQFHRQQQDHGDAAWALYELAVLFREEGNLSQAGTHAQDALTLFRSAGDIRGEGWAQMVICGVKRGYGSYYDALGHIEQALTTFQKVHDQEGTAWALRDRGTLYEALGEYSSALRDYEEGLRLFSDAGLRIGQAWVLADKAVVFTDQGKLDEAEKLGNESITLFREQGIRRGEAWALRALGDAIREQHDFDRARLIYKESLALFAALGDRIDQARVQNALGALAFDEKDYLAARDLYERAHSLAQEQGTSQIAGRALRGLGDVARIFQRFAEAERFYSEAAEIAVHLDTPAEQCAVLRRQGQLALARQHYETALDCWVRALSLDQRLGHPVRTDLQMKVEELVTAHQLETSYTKLRTQHSLT